MKEWIEDELVTADLGDSRLQKRMKIILERLVESPMVSIKSAFKGWAEVIAAYRFINNNQTTVESILKPHQNATLQRIKEYERVLMVQDTTELDYSTKKSLKGTGPLSSTNRQGFFAHNHLIITPEHLCLGVWHTQIYARNENEHGKAEQRKQKPIEEKESYRWLEGYQDACSLAELVPDTKIISCADREGDIFDIFDEWNQRRVNDLAVADWLIRCKHNRNIIDADLKIITDKKIRDLVETSPTLGTISVHVKGKEQNKKVKGGSRKKMIRSARVAVLEIKSTKVTPKTPFRKGKKFSEVSFYVVMAKEKNPPGEEEAINWVLLTSVDITDFDSAKEIIELYRARWEIEVFHRVLKTGCKVEELQLKSDEPTKVAIALYMIVAWRVLYVMKLGRECPELPCDIIFEEDEWKSFWTIVYGPEGLEKKPLLGEFVNKVAEYGGFLGRKGDGHPGPQAIWQGLTRLRDFTIAWQVYVKKEPFILKPTK